jgi:glycerol-3-phosphate dehydrogenase
MTPRHSLLDRVRSSEPWDLIIIGGGATGLGTALDSTTRGYRTLLLEAHDFAKATSSRSTKLIHGGVRYLAQGNLGLVREALRERGRLIRNAPHLVNDLAFLVPAYHWWDRTYYGLGLSIYDRLAGALALGRSRIVEAAEALELAKTLQPKGLRGGVVYHDGQFDDARLAIALVRSIDDHGGTALNGVGVTALSKDSTGRVAGVRARDGETGETFEAVAKAVINATGVFTDELRRLDEPDCAPIIAPSQGAHLVLGPEFLPGNTAILVPKTDDGRVLFAIPWHDRVVVGTTDTPVRHPSLEPRPLQEELDFLRKHAGRYLAQDLRPSDVLSVYAGLRPLISPPRDGQARTSRISREHAMTVSHSGLVSIAGGKWTTYRRMGEVVVDLAAREAKLPVRPSVTADLRLHGWQAQRAKGPLALYGADAPALERLCAEKPEWREPLHPRLPYRAGEVVWAARFEAARTVEDVLARRTRALLLDARAAIEASEAVSRLLAAELGRDDRWSGEQVRAFGEVASGYLMPA